MPRSTITFGAVGDIALTGAVATAAAARGLDWPFAPMRAQLERADILFGSMESVFIPDDYPAAELDPRGLISRLPGAAAAAALRHAGFDFLNLAANHVLDAGTVGLEHTARVLREGGLAVGGIGRTQADARALTTLERDGVTFGFLCYCEDSNYSLGARGPCHAYYTRDAVLEDVATQRARVDVLVVSVHGDLEFMPTPSVPRLQTFRDIARAGATLVLGHHPHVPQGCELVDGALIVYSLGNFVFAAHSSPHLRRHAPATTRSFLLLADVGRDGVRSFERVPFEITAPPEERPIPLAGAARDGMLTHLTELDRHLQDDAFVRQVWREAAKRRFETYLEQIPRRAPSGGARWRRAMARLLDPGRSASGIDVDRLIDDLVPRLALAAENRSWMTEILQMGRERWERRNAETPDPLHRPHYRFTRRFIRSSK